VGAPHVVYIYIYMDSLETQGRPPRGYGGRPMLYTYIYIYMNSLETQGRPPRGYGGRPVLYIYILIRTFSKELSSAAINSFFFFGYYEKLFFHCNLHAF
jgi:hypothetical protein